MDLTNMRLGCKCLLQLIHLFLYIPISILHVFPTSILDKCNFTERSMDLMSSYGDHALTNMRLGCKCLNHSLSYTASTKITNSANILDKYNLNYISLNLPGWNTHIMLVPLSTNMVLGCI
jgi:hypothetical protein